MGDRALSAETRGICFWMSGPVLVETGGCPLAEFALAGIVEEVETGVFFRTCVGMEGFFNGTLDPGVDDVAFFEDVFAGINVGLGADIATAGVMLLRAAVEEAGEVDWIDFGVSDWIRSGSAGTTRSNSPFSSIMASKPASCDSRNRECSSNLSRILIKCSTLPRVQ